MQELIEKFNKMPAIQKLLILGLFIALIFIIYFMAIYLPQQEAIKELEKKRDATDIELNEKKQIADNLPKYQEEVARLDEELQKQLQKLPNKAEIPKILRTISDLVVLSFAVGMIYYGIVLMQLPWKEVMPSLHISGAFRYLPLTAGGVLILLFSLERIALRWSGIDVDRDQNEDADLTDPAEAAVAVKEI